jgi:hypothetical protein
MVSGVMALPLIIPGVLLRLALVVLLKMPVFEIARLLEVSAPR